MLIRRSPLLFVAALALAALAAGCGGKPAKPAAQAAKPASGAGPVIGVSLLTRTHPFYQELEAGLRAAAEERGYQLLVQAGEFDVAKQKDQLADFLVRKVAAIVVCPCDSRSIGTSIKAANDAGVPVFTADIAVLDPGVKVVCHVASDNEAGGRLAARALVRALNGQGDVAIIDQPEVESVIARVHGFEQELAATPGVRVVAKLTGHGVKDGAFRTAEDILQAHRGLAGIFGINDDSALGALAAVEKAGRQGRIAIVGFDAVPEARRAIAEGKLFADVVQQPRLIGRQTVESIANYLSGQGTPPQVLIPCSLYGSEDARREAAGGAGR
jgi:ribose transport system substrate-binding protein